MQRSVDSSGFTLIEIALVIVVIGLIVAAVMKGQDLIQNARAKQFITFVREAETAQWNYLDRKGRYNGDTDLNGTISSQTTPYTWSGFSNPPETSVLLGSYTYRLFYGYRNSGSNVRKSSNFIVVNKITTTVAAKQFQDDELVFPEALDLAIDGEVDGTTGRVRGHKVQVIRNGKYQIANFVDYDDDDCKGIVYFFDKNFVED